ncbi:hypothetical protein HBI45_041160 [Parastagonospora nodorum]|nr:hypothetical protein HBI45_041160 [Parastagonospora nodorum]
MPHTTMEVTDKDDNTMDITNEGDIDTPSQDVLGADLAVALLPANSWTQHLNDPASTLATISPPALHQIIGHGTTEYEKMVEAWRAEKARADRLQAEKDEMIRQLQANKVETIGAAPFPFRSKGATWPRSTTHPLRSAQADGYIDYSLPKPTYRDRCIQEGRGKQCPRNRCKYVHKGQEELYGDFIAGLEYANKAAKVNDHERMEI